MSDEKHYLSNGAETAPAPTEALEWSAQDAGQARRPQVHGPARVVAAHDAAARRRSTRSSFEDGLGFDGSSIRGWQGISESDMLLMPQADTAILDPFTEEPTISILCEIVDPITREPYAKDPRRLARRAEEYLRSTGVADTCYFGPESEFFVFDSVAYDMQRQPRATTRSTPSEGHWNSGAPGLGYTVRPKEGYFPPAPHDTLHDMRSEMVLTLERLGIPCEFHHHEVATGGQCEIDMRFGTLTRMADQVMTYKYVVKNVARQARQDGDVHAEAALRRQRLGHALPPVALEGRRDADGRPVRATRASRSSPATTSAASSPTPRRCSRSAPRRRTRTAGSCRATRRRSTSSTRSATARRASASRCTRESPKAKRIEFRCPDPTANPYLAFSAMLMAGLDGIERELDPGAPADYDLFEESHGEVAQVPGSLDGVARRARGRPRVPDEGRTSSART